MRRAFTLSRFPTYSRELKSWETSALKGLAMRHDMLLDVFDRCLIKGVENFKPDEMVTLHSQICFTEAEYYRKLNDPVEGAFATYAYRPVPYDMANLVSSVRSPRYDEDKAAEKVINEIYENLDRIPDHNS